MVMWSTVNDILEEVTLDNFDNVVIDFLFCNVFLVLNWVLD